MNGNDIHKFGLTLSSQEKDWLANFLISMYSCGENLGDMREINCEEGDEAWNAWADKYEDILMSIDDNTAYELIFQSLCDPLEGDGELFVGCKCVETQWADGGENTRNEPMVTFKWPGVAKAIKKCYKGLHLNDFEDCPDIMRSVADLMEVHNALLEGKPIDLKLLTRILEEEIGNWGDAIADESAWPERDPFGYTTQTIHNAQACKRLLTIALALLK